MQTTFFSEALQHRLDFVTMTVLGAGIASLVDSRLHMHGAITMLGATFGTLVGAALEPHDAHDGHMEGMVLGTWAAGFGGMLGSLITPTLPWSTHSMLWMSALMGGMLGGSTADWLHSRESDK